MAEAYCTKDNHSRAHVSIILIDKLNVKANSIVRAHMNAYRELFT